MGRKFILTDDLTGEELPEDTEAIRLQLGRTAYNLFLSEDSHGKLLEALEPFIADAEKEAPSRGTPARASSTSNADKEKLKAVRAWAQSSGYKYKNAAGEEVTLGDRGRIPQEVIDAYEKAN